MISLAEIKRFPVWKASLAQLSVYIFSREHGCYWRPGGCGYTGRISEAGVWSFEEAFKRVGSCGPEKGICLEIAGPEYYI